jgi:hypothetical protein
MPNIDIRGTVSDRHGIPLRHALRLDTDDLIDGLETQVPATDDFVLSVIDGVLGLTLVSDLPSGAATTIFDILSGNAILTVSQPDISAANVTLTVDETQINHDNLTGFVANEHIDHTSVTLTAGIGLSGGGDISASRTFNLDIPELTVDVSPDEAADYLATYDASAAAHRRILISSIDHDNLTGFVANEHIDHTSVTLTAGAGLSGGGDISANRTFALDINELSEDTTPDEAADFLVTYDASAGDHKKVHPNNIQPVVTNATGTLPIANGGTGQTAQTAAFNALDPLTTKGDLIVHDGTNSVRVPVGANGTFLQADSTDAEGVIWSSIPGASDTIVTLGSDQESSSSALADVTAFGFTMAANTMYYIKYTIRTSVTGSSPATTEGHLYTVNGSTAATFISLIWTRYTSSPTAPTCTSITAYDGGAITSSTAFINEGIETIEGIISNGASSSTLVLRFRTETNGSASVRTSIQAGSYLQYRVVT